MSTPELSELGPNLGQEQLAWRELGETFRFDPTMEQLKEFDQIVDRTLLLEPDPTRAELLRPGADYLKWILFAKPGDPLPPSLELFKNGDLGPDDDQLWVGVTSAHPASRYNIADVQEAFVFRALECGLVNFLSDYSVGFDLSDLNRDQSDYQIAAAALKQSPAYKFLQLFTEQGVNNHERPLTPFEKLGAATVIGELVRINHRIPAGKPIPIEKHDGARRELEKRVMDLDEATKPDKHRSAEEESDPAKVLRDYFLRLLQEEVADRYPSDTEFIDCSDEAFGGIPAFTVNYRDGESIQTVLVSLGSFKQGIARRFMREHGRTISWGGDEFDLDGKFVLGLMTKINGKTPPVNAIHDAIVGTISGRGGFLETKQEFLSVMKFFGRDEPAFIAVSFEMDVFQRALRSPAWIRLLQPTNNVTLRQKNNTEATPTFPYDAYPRDRQPSITDFEDAAREEKQTLLRVTRGPEGRRDHVSRMLLSVPRASTQGIQQELPAEVKSADLTLHHAPAERNYFDIPIHPSIPGYTLVGASEDASFYNRLPGHDPYDEPTTVIPESGRQALLDWYKQTGLYDSSGAPGEIAKAIEELPVLRAVDIRDAIIQGSDYTYDAAFSPGYGNIFVTDSDGGRPKLQCDGANKFLEKSLKIALPDTPVRMIAGYMLDPGSNTVNGSRHAQVAMVDDGKQFIIDATPPLRGGERIRRAGSAQTRSGQRTKARDVLSAIALAPMLPLLQLASLKREKSSKSDAITSIDESKVEPDVSVPGKQLVTSRGSNEKTAEPLAEVLAPRQTTEEIRAKLENHLQVLFKAPNRQRMLEQVSGLPEADPVRRTLSLAIQATDYADITTDVPKLQKYINDYKQPPAAALRDHKLARYNPETLGWLANCIDDLQRSL